MAKKKSKKQDWEIIDDVSTMGYRDDSPYRNRESIDIYSPNGLIDMSETGMPILANGRYLPPYSGMHQFNPGVVREERIMQDGGDIDPEMLYKNKYNTPLNKRQTKKFNKWVEQESIARKRDILMDLGAYDVQGFWKSKDYKNRDSDGHGSDRWKKPNHPTFSNQSVYSGVDGNYGGEWKPDGAYLPSKQTLDLYGEDYLRDQFLREPNRPEYLDMSRFESGQNKPTPLVYKTGGSIPIMQTGGRPPLKILDPREFKIREQAYNDSLNLFLSSEKQKEALRSSGYSPLGNTPWSGGIASHPTIKPIQEEAWGKNGITSTWIDVYKKPVQPVVYEPRPNQTPIQLDRKEGLLESNPINLGDINPIPFEPGSYFTRERKPQEADRGKMEYFDKKTGRSIGLYANGGRIPKAQIGTLTPGSSIGIDMPTDLEPLTGLDLAFSKQERIPIQGNEELYNTVINNPKRYNFRIVDSRFFNYLPKEETPIQIKSKKPDLLQSQSTTPRKLEFTRERQPGERFSALYTPQGQKYSAVDVKDKSGKLVRTIDPKTGKLAFKHPVTGEEQFEYGGELPEAGSGYKVVRSSERKGKTHKVTGPDGTVKFFGDSKLGQHPKDPARKKAFYARHKKNLDGNPYFRAFARKTWEYGGELTENDIPMAGNGKTILSYLNPKNWGVTDYTTTGNFDSAFSTARKAGEKEFLYNGQRFNTRKDTDPIEYIGNNPNQGEYDKILRTQYPEFYKILNRGQNVGNISFEGASLDQPDRGFIKKNPNLLSSGNSKIAVGQNPSLQKFIGTLIAETAHLKDKNLDKSIFNPYSWKSRFESTGLDDDTMYKIPGNMEYNTHRLFEPGIAMLAYGNLSPDDIKRIQKYLEVKEDGYFGEKTYKALQDKYKDDEYIKEGISEHQLYTSDKDINPIHMGNFPGLSKRYLKVLSKDVPIKDYKRFTSGMDAYPDYTDNALKNINIADNNSFDTYILQQTLNNRGYKLPKSIKEDGSFDGVLGDETKKALLDYQAKNKPYTQKAPLPGQSVPTMDFAQGGMLPDLNVMAFGGNLILEKYQDGGSNWEILPQAQTGTQTGYSWSTQQAPSYQPTFQGNYANSQTTGNRALTSKEMQALKVYGEKRVQEQKEAEYAARQARIKESIAAQNQPLSAENIMTQSQSTGDKMSFAMNTPFGNPKDYPVLSGYMEGLDYINPFKFVGDMASGLGAVPYNVQQGNYGQAAIGVAAPLITGALAGIGTQGTRQFVNNLVNPVAGINFRKGAKQIPGSGVASSVDDVGRSLTQAPKPAWQMEELPGLHLKSTMEGQAISKIVEPKTGLINVEQALGIIGKESGGADKVAMIRKGLGDNIPKKMDFNEFRKITQEQLIPLERQFATHSSGYGVDRLGYPGRTGVNIHDSYIKEIKIYEDLINKGIDVADNKYWLEKVKKDYSNAALENQTLILGNKNKFGRGSGAHGNPEETLGHAHFLRDAETPDVLTVTQIQSDAFQGTHRIMPKNAPDVSKVEKSLQRMQELQERNKSVLNKMKTEGVDEAGLPVQQYQIKQFEDIVQAQEAANLMKKGEVENFTQKSLLDKNHQERYLQELVDYAGKRGDVNKVRVPTSETAAKVQGYRKSIPTHLDDNLQPVGGGKYSSEHQTILKKYSEQPKTIKKLFGEEPKIVTDSKGNTWYEFDIPKKFKEGKGEIKALSAVGVVGTGAATQTKNEPYRNGGKIKPKSSNWEIVSDNEWEVLNEKPSYQKGGKVVSEIWQDVTGTPWSEAKKLGLTKGGYEENLAIRAELLKNPEKFISLVKEYSGKTKTQPAVQQPVQQPITNKYNSFAARSFSQPYFEGDTYQEAAPSPNVQQPLPTYQWSNQQRVAPNLAAGDTPVATPRKAAPPKTQRVAITQRLPDLPLITNPIDSPYFQAPIESTKVVPQMIKKGKQDSSIIQSIVDTINKSEFLKDVKDTIRNVKDVEDVKNSLIRGLGKTGLYAPDTEEVEPMKVPTQKPIIQPIAKPTMNSSAVQDTTPTAYYQGKGILDPKTGTEMGRYVNTFSNWKGQEYIPTKNVGEWKKDKTTQYPSSQIAHYLLDVDLTTGYQHRYSKNYIESQKKGESITKGSTLKEQWLPVYEKLPNGNVRMKYKTNKELTKDDKIAAPLRQYKFGDLDWNSDIKSSWNKSSSALTTKTGEETLIIKSGKDMSGYGQFGGGSFVLISKRKNGEVIVRELAGSAQDLKIQAEDLAKMTGQNVNEIVVGYHDVGSWSAKPSSKNKKMGYSNIPKKSKNEFHSYQEDHTGAGLAFPFAYGGLTKSNWEIIK